MVKTMAMAGILAAITAAPARAEDDCYVAIADWQPREAVAQMAGENGWSVRRIKIDDGCYEVVGRDADGRRIEATVHPATLQVLRIEYEIKDDTEDRGHDGGHDGGHENHARQKQEGSNHD